MESHNCLVQLLFATTFAEETLEPLSQISPKCYSNRLHPCNPPTKIYLPSPNQPHFNVMLTVATLYCLRPHRHRDPRLHPEASSLFLWCRRWCRGRGDCLALRRRRGRGASISSGVGDAGATVRHRRHRWSQQWGIFWEEDGEARTKGRTLPLPLSKERPDPAMTMAFPSSSLLENKQTKIHSNHQKPQWN